MNTTPTPTPDNSQPKKNPARRATDHPAMRIQGAAQQGADAPTDRVNAAPPDWQKGTVIDRRVFPDRRAVVDPRDSRPATTHDDPTVAEPADTTGLERRRGRGRRLSDFTRSAEVGEMTPEQFLFLMAIDEFKKANARTFPTWTDVLEIIRLLGYRKTMASELNLTRAEDWTELPTTPSNVRPMNWERRAAA